jgi:hypothetical protein
VNSFTERDEGHALQHGGRKAKKPRLNREQNTQEARPNTNKRKPHKTQTNSYTERDRRKGPPVRNKTSQPLCNNRVTERDGRKGPPAGNKAKCNRTNTPHSKATQRKAKPNKKPQTHTRGERQAYTT